MRPINYSLKGAILHIDTGPGLKIEGSYGIEMERYMETDCDAGGSKAEVSVEDSPVSPKRDSEVLQLSDDSKIVFSEWASNVSSIMWVPVRALSEKLPRGSSSGLQQYIFFLIITCLLSHTFTIIYFFCVDSHSTEARYFRGNENCSFET